MVHKSSIKLACSCASSQRWHSSALAAAAASASISASSTRRRASSVSLRRPQISTRRRASTIDGPLEMHEHVWPKAVAPNKLPTPYQIFEMERRSAYSKKRFYELAKIYHPDRAEVHKVSVSGVIQIPPATRTDRFRMIVAAHEILSSPERRKAYDVYGAGWEVRGAFSPGSPGPFNQRDWREDYRGSPAQNATWEDWERWYDGRGPQARPAKRSPQEEQFLSNPNFIFALAILAAVGTYVQFNRAEKRSLALMDQRVRQHEALTEDLSRRRSWSSESTNRHEEQVERFLRSRDKHLAMAAQSNSQIERFYTGKHSRSSQSLKSGDESDAAN